MIGCSFGGLQLGIARKKDQFRQKREEERRDVGEWGNNNNSKKQPEEKGREAHQQNMVCFIANKHKQERARQTCMHMVEPMNSDRETRKLT